VGVSACPHRSASSVTTRVLAAELAERGVAASHMAVWRFLREEAITFKNVWPAPFAR
jgi:transposase